MKKIVPQIEGYYYRASDHTYAIDGVLATGVTTVQKSAGSDPGGLIQWGANLSAAEALGTPCPTGWHDAYNAVIAKYGKLTSDGARELDVLFPAFKFARTAHARIRDGAADVGKAAHKVCEDFEKGIDISQTEPLILKRAQPYLDWYKENIEKTHFVEMPLFSRTMFLGGTPDGGFQTKDGKNYINDKKFKNAIGDPTANWQMGAYYSMLQGMKDDSTTKVTLELENGVTKEYRSPQEYLADIGGITWDGFVVLLMDGVNGVQPIYRYSMEEDVECFKAQLLLYRKREAYKVPYNYKK